MDIRLPDGTVLRNVPEGTSKSDIISRLKKSGYDTSSLEEKAPESPGFLGSIAKGTKSLLSSGLTALESAVAPEEAAKAGLKRQEEISKQYGEGLSLDKLKEIYEKEGFLPAAKEVVSEIPSAIGEQVPNIGALAAGARLGAMAGAPLGPYGAIAGGALGALAPSLLQQYGGNIERQAAEQQARGEEVDINRARALGLAAPQAALDVAAQAIPLGRTLAGKLFGREIEELLVKGEKKAAEKLANESLTKSLIKGTAVGALAEIPTEVTQQALERLNAGLSLTDDDALKEYADTAFQVSLLAPIGALGRVSERAAAREQVAAAPTTEAQPTDTTAVERATPVAPAEEEKLSPDASKAIQRRIDELYEDKQQVDAREARERLARELRFNAMQDDRLRVAMEREEQDLANKDDEEYLRQFDEQIRAKEQARRVPPTQQMGLPLGEEGGEQLQLPMGPTETGVKEPSLFTPAEDVLSDLRPRSREYKEAAKDLGLKLTRSGELKPYQYVPEQITSEVSPDQMRLDLRGRPAAELSEDESQTAFNFPGVPMERLTPSDRVLRVMGITEIPQRKTKAILQSETGLSPSELSGALFTLKDQGALAYNPKAKEWELTPEGAQRVRTDTETKAPRTGRSVPLSVQRGTTKGTGPSKVTKRGMAPAGAAFERLDEGEGQGTAALTAEPDRISQRIIQSGVGSDFVKMGLYSPVDPMDFVYTQFEDLENVTPEEIETSKNYIKQVSQDALRNQYGDEVTLYRGVKGTEDKSPVLSYSLNKNTAKFFAEQQGIRSGKIEEIKVPVSDVLSYSEAIGRGTFDEQEVLIRNPAFKAREATKPEEFIYHVTRTESVPSIEEKGLLPMQTSNWVQRGNKKRYGEGEVYAFTNKEDAQRWAAKMDWEFNSKLGSGKISIVKATRPEGVQFDVDKNDPFSQAGSKGPWLKTKDPIPAENIVSTETYSPTKAAEEKTAAPSILETKIDKELGHCFSKSLKGYVPGSKLVHAYITNAEGRRFPHAWVEKDGKVIDYTLNKTFSKKEYYKVAQVSQEPGQYASYNYPEGIKKAVKNKNFGPWDLDLAENRRRSIDMIRQAQEKRVAQEEARKTESLWTRVVNAYDLGLLDDATYEKIYRELKKSAPDMAFINKVLAEKTRVKVADKIKTKKPVAPTLKENSTDAEIANYYARAQERDKAAGVKPLPKIGKPKIETEQIAPEDSQLFKSVEPTSVSVEPKPKWATEHEGDTGGQVVYADDDVALLRGHSVITGQNVYVGIDRKTGNRTRVDIESFTGSLFTPEQKQKLLQVKKSVIDADAKLLAANPDGPFTGAKSNVVASENVDPNYTNFLSSLMRSMGLGDVRVFLLHPEDVYNQQDKYKLYGIYSSAMSAGLDSGEQGSLRAYGPNLKDFYMSFRSGMPEGRTIETIAHELGHLIERVVYQNAKPEVKAAIRAEYETWLKENKGKNAADLINALRNRETAAAHSATVTANTKLRDSYWRSFSEWFADNTSKWVTTSEKPVGVVEKFFSDLAKKLRELVAKITGNRFVPAKSVKDFLDAMGPGAADSWLDAKGITEKNPFDNEARYSMTPEEQRVNDARYIQTIGNSQNVLPEPTPEIKEGSRTAMSIVPSWLRRGVFSFESPHQMADMYRPYTDQLDEIWDLENREGAALRTRTDQIHATLEKGAKVMSKYTPAQRDRFYGLMLKTSVDSIEVLDSATDPLLKDNAALKDMKLTWKPNTTSDVYRQFMALPKEVRDLYTTLRLAYIEYAHQMEKVMENYLTPSEWQKLQMEFNKKRLPVYLPLFRHGDYKLIYKDKDGDTNVRQFETDAERQTARRELVRSGIPNSGIIDRMQNEFTTNDIPPAGFYGKVVAALRDKGVNDDVIKQVFDLYMDYLPSNSVLQLRRKRENIAGYELDVLRGYASVGSAYARRLTKMEFMPKLATAYENLQADLNQGSFWVSYKDKNGRLVRNGFETAELRQGAIDKALKEGADRASVKMYGLKDEEARDVVAIAGKQLDFFNNPQMDNISSKAAYFSYTMYMGGNVSSAVIDLTHIPMVVYSLLGGKHGFGKTAASMARAHSQYINNKFPAELSEMPSLIKRATEEGVLGEQRLADLAEFQNKLGPLGSKALEVKARADRMLGYIFKVADKYNRGLTFISAYDLAKGDLKKRGLTGDALVNEAYKEAKRAVFDSYGSSFPRTGPAIAGNGLAKLALTFKRFAINRLWLLSKAFIEAGRGESKEVRNIARKQLLGYFGMAYLFAGVQGMPLVGAGQLMASLLNGAFGDDDEPYDPQQETLNAVGMFNFRGPLNNLLDLDISSRSGWDQMLWRDDPRRIAEVGPATYAMEQLLGPAFGYAVNVPRAMDHFSEGRFSKGMETLTPRVLSNFLKAYRFGTEGALTSDNVPIVKDVSKYNQFMQILGFAPSEISEAYQKAGVVDRTQKQILERRNSILRRVMMSIVAQDEKGREKALEEVRNFNQKHPGKAISSDSIRKSVTQHYVKMNQSVAGIRLDPKLAREVYDQIGYEPEDEEEED